jgi:D-methionine transport system substrate-binding protein
VSVSNPPTTIPNNFIAVRDRDKDALWVPKLVRAYQNDTIRELIKDKLPGQIPAF